MTTLQTRRYNARSRQYGRLAEGIAATGAAVTVLVGTIAIIYGMVGLLDWLFA